MWAQAELIKTVSLLRRRHTKAAVSLVRTAVFDKHAD